MGEQLVLGLTEEVTIIGSAEEIVQARIDTGATSSSIDMTLAEKLELGPVIREKVVKSASGIEKRDLIMVKVKVAGRILEEEFSVADRHHMTYPVLIGQNVLIAGNFLIDPKKKK
jgi:hypothetical protein